MELAELKAIWRTYDEKLEKTLQLNLRCLEAIQAQKVRSKLTPLFWLRIVEVVVHVAVLYWLAGFAFHHIFTIYYVVPAGLLMLFYMIALINCIGQIVLIKQIDYTENITTIQKKLTLLQISIVNYIRLAFLGIPTYLAYPIIALEALAGFDIVRQMGNSTWWTAQLIFTAVLFPVCAWLYLQVNYKNIHKKWVRFIIKHSAGNAVSGAMEFVRELDELKTN